LRFYRDSYSKVNAVLDKKILTSHFRERERKREREKERERKRERNFIATSA
jgi:hypothetical protein